MMTAMLTKEFRRLGSCSSRKLSLRPLLSSRTKIALMKLSARLSPAIQVCLRPAPHMPLLALEKCRFWYELDGILSCEMYGQLGLIANLVRRWVCNWAISSEVALQLTKILASLSTDHYLGGAFVRGGNS